MLKKNFSEQLLINRIWTFLIPNPTLIRHIVTALFLIIGFLCFVSVWQFMSYMQIFRMTIDYQNIVGFDANLLPSAITELITRSTVSNDLIFIFVVTGFSLGIPFLLAIGFMFILLGLRLLITLHYSGIIQSLIQLMMILFLFLLSGVIYYQYPLLGGYLSHVLITQNLLSEEILIKSYSFFHHSLLSSLFFSVSLLLYSMLLIDICLGALNVSWTHRSYIWVFIPRMICKYIYLILAFFYYTLRSISAIIMHIVDYMRQVFINTDGQAKSSGRQSFASIRVNAKTYDNQSVNRNNNTTIIKHATERDYEDSDQTQKSQDSTQYNQDQITQTALNGYNNKQSSTWSGIKSIFSSEKKSSHNAIDSNSHHCKTCTTKTEQANTYSVSDNFVLPPLKLLGKAPASRSPDAQDKLLELSLKLKKVLEDFGIHGDILDINTGPVVNLFEFQPAPGTKTSKIIALERDIARSLEMASARVAIVRGKNAVGIELPNASRQTIYLSELLSDAEIMYKSGSINLALGKSIDGKPYFADLCKMPHLLVAGTTGSGKSVAINTMLLSILLKLSPAQCRLILIDPKMLEMAFYNDIPHLLIPVVVDPKQAVLALQWVVREMERRYLLMSKIHARNIISYNHKLFNLSHKEYDKLKKHSNCHDKFQYFSDKPEHLPYIVVVIDELADLMLVAGRDIEATIQRLSQMARAAGIHLIVATQRPSVDVITGTIKANFPTRISFQVSSKIDSRTILGDTGAEQLLGAGDMLLMAGAGRITRLHGSFVSEQEVESVNNFLRKYNKVNYAHDVATALSVNNNHKFNQSLDELYDRAVELIKSQGKCSTSMLQRHFQIGYNRAARIMDNLEDQGVVSVADHAGKRQIL